jgi:tetratricopeptide (TPR) repeat protein
MSSVQIGTRATRLPASEEIKMKPKRILSVVAIVALGIFLAGCNKTKIQMLKDDVKKNPKSAKTHVELAFFYQELYATDKNPENLKNALAEYDAAIKLRPTDYTAQMQKGKVLYDMRKFPEALLVFGPLLKDHAKDSVLHNNIAMCLHQMAQFDKALAEYNEALRLNPNNEPAQKGLAFLKADIKAAEAIKKKPAAKQEPATDVKKEETKKK